MLGKSIEPVSMKPTIRSLPDWPRGLLILIAALLVHLTLFLAFRHHVVWPSPPADSVDFIGFKVAPPSIALPSQSVSLPPELLPAASDRSSGQIENFPPLPSIMSITRPATNGPLLQPDAFSEAPGYFAVPWTATEETIGPVLNPVFSRSVIASPSPLFRPSFGFARTTLSFGPHVRVSDLRRTQPHCLTLTLFTISYSRPETPIWK
jgi:hypothetical protein